MAANKFTTMLHRNTNNKVTLALVYAVLEWFLILLLLLNSLFTYAITKFAMWVGLNPPCPFCSRLDHVLEPDQSQSFQSDLVCEAHTAQISNMAFCSNHRRMSDANTMCQDCFASRPKTEKTEETEKCYCCNKSLKLNLNPPYLLLESSLGDGNYKSKLYDDDEEEEGNKECEHHILSDIESFILREVAEDRSEDAEKEDLTIITGSDGNLRLRRFSDESIWEEDIITMHFENGVAAFCNDDDDDDYDNHHRMIPVELIDSFDSANFGSCERGLLEPKIETLENSMVLEVEEKPDNAQDADQSSSSDDDAEVKNAFDEFIAQNNLCQSQSLSYDDCNIKEADNTQANLPQSEEDQSSTSDDGDEEVPNAFDEFIAQNKLCPVQKVVEDDEDVEMNLVEQNHEEKIFHHESSKFAEEKGELEEEDKLPETPNSMDGLHYLHRKLMLLEKTESIDGLETENIDDPTSTLESLKTALKAERKALSALYQELEEERNASAISANQTMAMITRLQEEKAAMQMEALQYQRMMEEQSEYDQEAMQLLNDLVMKREKEKEELEKELEEYKQKVLEYEAKEKLRVLRRMKTAKNVKTREESESSSSLGDDNCEAREEEEEDNNNNINTTNHMSVLDSSLAEFEEEKMSILYQLKELEEKLVTLGENDQFLEVDEIPEEDMYPNNEISDDKQCNSPRRPMGCLAKRLLPFLDNEADDDNATEEALYSCERQKMENSGIEDEVDHVYERLQALETDTDFLRHCMGSIQKGDKGMDLLEEILQHFRDLKDVELRLKDLGDDDDDPLV